MKIRTSILIFFFAIFLSAVPSFQQHSTAQDAKSIYHDGWIDLNKNGRMDVYENQRAPINARVEDLLRQMNLDEKTCQTATLETPIEKLRRNTEEALV